MEEMLVSAHDLAEQCVRHFMDVGLSADDARIATDVLVHAYLIFLYLNLNSRMP